jgi:hypothetical protein
MGVNWAAGLMRWDPHFLPNGEMLSLAHLDPFLFDIRFPADQRGPARKISILVGFSCHVFTRAVENAGPLPELYSDSRETRAFDHVRYDDSFRLKGIVTDLESRKCYFARRDCFLTIEDTIALQYRVFFTMRRKDRSTAELIVQSAYSGKKEGRPRGQVKRPIRFRSIVANVISRRKMTEAP